MTAYSFSSFGLASFLAISLLVLLVGMVSFDQRYLAPVGSGALSHRGMRAPERQSRRLFLAYGNGQGGHPSQGAPNPSGGGKKPITFDMSMLDYLKIVVLAGVPFGLIWYFFDPQITLEDAFYTGLGFGAMFAIAMWGVNRFLAGKFSEQRAAISRERQLICDGSATNHGNGGWMFFTENGLEFYPHKMNLSRKKIIIPIRLIESTEVVSNKLVIKLAGDLSYEFIVRQSNGWKRCIDGYMAGATASPHADATHTDATHTDSVPHSSTRNDAPHKTKGRTAAYTSSNYVFISYSSKNQSEAESTRALLRESGIRTWMAPYDIPAGSKYAFVINDAIEKCACVLLLLTEDSQSSQFVEREVERAVAYNKTIVSMQLDNCTLNSGFRYYLGNEQIVPVREIDADNPAVQKVIEGVRALVNLG